MIAFLIVQALVFTLWAGLAFRTLGRLWRHVRQQTGAAVPGLSGTALAARAFWAEAGFASDRRLLGVVTALLLGLSALTPLVFSKDG